MNILGKILVFLNLLFALVVGGFLLIDFQTRVNWKKSYDDLLREAKVAQTNQKVLADTARNQDEKNAELSQKLADAQKKFKEDLDKKDSELLAYKKARDEATLGNSKDLVLAEKFRQQFETLKLENKTFADLVDKRDKQVLLLEEEKDKYFREAQQALNDSQIAQARLTQLQKRLKEMELDKAQQQVAKNGGKGAIKDKYGPNPPPFYIKGVIEKVDAEDNSLVQLSLGKDHGLEVGNTLEAFRRTPQPSYLGLIRIEEVTAHKSVGRLVPNPYSPPVTLRAKDEVASQILPGY